MRFASADGAQLLSKVNCGSFRVRLLIPCRQILMWTSAAFVAALCVAGVFADVIPRKVGCFEEATIKLEGFRGEYPAGLTPKRCNLLCFNKAFTHAATFNGSICICGDLIDGTAGGDSNGFCSSPCSGDSADRCGGPSAYSLYETGLREVSEEDVEDYEIGCVTDGGDQRLIQMHKQDLTLTNTPKKCVEYCRALGFWHAGVEYTFECYCGDASRLSPVVSGCDLQCVGDEDQICGGNWKISVYRTGITSPPLVIRNKGCYPLSKRKILSETSMDNMEPNKCIAHCFEQGFKLAYVHNGRDCLCANVHDRASKKLKAGECSTLCPGNKLETCGSEANANMYTTGIVGEKSAGKLEGCYLDTRGTILKGPKVDLGENNSPDKCITKCIELGHSFAGLRNSTECHCGDENPKRLPVRIRPDAQCDTPCPGDPTQNCGTENKLSLYRTGLSYVSKDDCVKTLSRVNGKPICGGVLIFEDEFDKLDLSKWQQDVRFSGKDGEFVTYTGNKKNLFIEDGKLVIKPIIMNDDTVRGTVKLDECTSSKPKRCSLTAKSFSIVPPVMSGRICTKETLNFKYGIVTVRAKLPKGDWVVPEISLIPKEYAYGRGFKSGRIIVAQALGNDDLITEDGVDIGSKLLKTGLQASTMKEGPVKERMTLMPSGTPWHNEFQNYSIKWAQDTFEFYLNDNLLNIKCTYMNSGSSVTKEMGFDTDELINWKNGTNMAPFDQEFHICLGVSVGGNIAFPDKSKSSGKPKPWSNYKVKGMLDFWKARDEWFPSWNEDTKLEIDYLSVTSG